MQFNKITFIFMQSLLLAWDSLPKFNTTTKSLYMYEATIILLSFHYSGLLQSRVQKKT